MVAYNEIKELPISSKVADFLNRLTDAYKESWNYYLCCFIPRLCHDFYGSSIARTNFTLVSVDP